MRITTPVSKPTERTPSAKGEARDGPRAGRASAGSSIAGDGDSGAGCARVGTEGVCEISISSPDFAGNLTLLQKIKSGFKNSVIEAVKCQR